MALMTDFNAVFMALKRIYTPYASAAVVTHDGPGKYLLGTHEVRPKDGYRTAFGGVDITTNYVSAHLMPVYVHPELLAGISSELRKRMQGKSCFNFRNVQPDLFDEYSKLVAMGFERFKQDGRFNAA
jgi:hypothetical protein